MKKKIEIDWQNNTNITLQPISSWGMHL